MKRIPTTESMKTECDSILAQLSFHRKGPRSAEGLGFSFAVERNDTGKGAESRKKSTFAFSAVKLILEGARVDRKVQ
jgi:hypothetical protein